MAELQDVGDGVNSCDGVDLQSTIMKRAIDHCVPVTLMVELGQACNFKCQHCYNFDRSVGSPNSVKPMDLDMVRSVLHQGRELGCITLCLTGGEVLLYPKLMEVVLAARGLHYAVR